MTINPIIFAATVFFSYFLGRYLGHMQGYKHGLKTMNNYVLRDMKKYPAKWKFLIDKQGK